MKPVFLVFLLLASVAAAALPPSVCDVTGYGAEPDGAANSAAAIQKAIDACAAAGGGTVYFPAGNFLSGTITLKSNITLNLSPGSTLWGSKKIADYEPLHLIYARDAENIAIEGGGAINGNGEAYWDEKFRPLKRPSPLIELVRCRNVRIQDVAIRNAPGWTIHPLECDGVRIRGISIVNHMQGPNTDGIDPDSSRNVHISDSYIEAGDDCIVLKTTGRLGRPARPCENVTVTNCTLVSDDAALKLGTESYGDFRHCVFSNCTIRGTRVGLAFYAKDGGTFEQVSFSNITIETYPTHPNSVEWPIFIDLEKRHEDSRVSKVRDLTFSDMIIHTKGRTLVGGLPDHPLENLKFHNILVRVSGFEPIEKVGKPRGSSDIRPVSRDVDYGSVPAAFIFANVRGLDLRDIRVVWDAQEAPQDRHAIYAARVSDLRITGFTGRQAAADGKLAAIGLDSVSDVFITGARADPGTNVFLGLNGTDQNEVVLAGNDLKEARRQVERGATYVHNR